MSEIIECVPNFSEARNREVIDKLVSAAKSVPGAMLLDYTSDTDHNRSVLTLAGDSSAIEQAAFILCKTAAENIDLTKHTGEHPRMGATDVIPFVPIRDTTMEACVEISKRVGKRIYDELKIPVFLYEYAAVSEDRRNLAAIRKGQFEGMPEKLKQEGWRPDYGERKIHPTAGVTAVGARAPLIAFNINLSTSDVKIAKAIAKAIRASNGGYQYCKAIGIFLKERNIAQVSMNMVNYDGTPLYRVFEAVKFEAKRWGVSITGSEIIGLTPAKALIDCAEYYLKLENFHYEQHVLENKSNLIH